MNKDLKLVRSFSPKLTESYWIGKPLPFDWKIHPALVN